MNQGKRTRHRASGGHALVQFVSLFATIALLLAACGSTANPTPTPTRAPSPTAAAAAGTPPLAASPVLPLGNDVKIDTVLLDVGEAYRQGGQPAAEQKARETGLLNAKNELRITLILSDTNTQAIADKVKSLGGRTPNIFDTQMDVVVPLDTVLKYVNANNQTLMQELAAYTNVKEVQVTPRPATEGLQMPAGTTFAEFQEAVQSLAVEGVVVSGADKWHAAGFTGKGIKIGIIDGGFKGYKALLGKELPQNLTVKAFTEDGAVEAGEHGTGVAEIVHAMAPDAELIICAIDSAASFANAIRYLTDEMKVQVIQHSMGWHTVRKDGNNFLAQQADYARGKGVLYVKSAGNEGDGHYTATFAPNQEGRHVFANGQDRLAVVSTGYVYLHLTWEAWTGDPVNYDLSLYDERGTKVASSRNVQGSQKPPYEGLFYEAPPRQKFYAVVEAVGPQKAVRFDLIGKNTPFSDKFAGVTPAGSISAPGDARGAFTIGAINFKDDVLESYSSQGPTIDGRRKPDLSAPTNVTTKAYGPEGFNGTSAATPHVSGAAALIFGAQSGATADQVQAFLQGNARDLEEAGPENKTGFGRLALGPVENATKPAPVAGASVGPSPSATARPSAAPSASARPSTAPSAAPAGQLRPTGTIPAGWQAFSHNTLPFAIAYPPNWAATERAQFGLFNPTTATTPYHYLQVLSGGRTSSNDQEQLREDGWRRISGNICAANVSVASRYESTLGNVRFPALEATCERPFNQSSTIEHLEIFVAAGVVGGMAWEISIVLPADMADEQIAQFLNPMLATLNIGGGAAASPAPSVAPRPSPSPSPAALRPVAPVPAGWRSYSGKTLPFAIAYPPDWTVEEDTASVAFVHPRGLPGVQISTLGSEFSATTAAQLRDDYYAELTQGCRDVQLQWTDSDTYGGVAFEDLAALCENSSGEVRFLYLAVGLQGSTKWAILIADTDDYADNIDTFFNPMLATLNFGATAAAPSQPSATPTARAQATATRAPTPRPQATSTPTPAPQSSATLTLSANTVAPGGTVEYVGTGFEPGLIYGLIITNEAGAVTLQDSVQADANGEFRGTITVGSAGTRLVSILFGGGDVVAVAILIVTP